MQTQHTYETQRRTTMFRGEISSTWERRMIQAGWPKKAVKEMVAFLFQERRLPSWEELTNDK